MGWKPIDRSKPMEYEAVFVSPDDLSHQKTMSFYADNLDAAWQKAKTLEQPGARLRDVRSGTFVP